ncbi:MAG: hypothetical protein QW153_01995 [Candidatus Bilamarchaeaceae archaeon]
MAKVKEDNIKAKALLFVYKINNSPYFETPLNETITNTEVIKRINKLKEVWEKLPERVKIYTVIKRSKKDEL